jgi:hypothetical protein
MGGVFGEIDSRSAFERVLEEAHTLNRSLLEASPDNPVARRIDVELDAMRRFALDGREPTKSERESIQVGLIAVRELDADRDDASGELARKLHVLNNYFEAWPTDAEAASATDADYWAQFGL